MMEIVRHGGYLLDVIIEHPFYGEITGQLRISTPEEVEQAIVRLSRKGSGMLSSVTDGVHMHTVEAEREEQLDDIEAALDAAGILCTD
jgi:transcriptional regulator of NAD metabolism